jgi:hypothetical protein
MPYNVGEKGSYGCSGYPVVKTGTGEVMGCHPSMEDANKQLAALHINEPDATKAMGDGSISNTGINPSSTADPHYPGVGIKYPEVNPRGKRKPRKNRRVRGVNRNGVSANANNSVGAFASGGPGGSMGTKSDNDVDTNKAQGPCWDGYVQRGMKPGGKGKMVPNCVPVNKADRPITEGDYVMGATSEGIVIGQVEHIMREGGVYGTPGTEYAIQSTPENPAMAVRMFEQEEDGTFCPTPYSIGMLYNDAMIVEIEIKNEGYDEEMSKAEGYSPPAGARSAARRAIKFKEEGKANGAGTAVGWTRARQLANGETLSLSTVKRMYSYFSRHEVDKKGKDWGNQANPSNGYIMWLAWGGDAGYSWSRSIVEREAKKVDSNFWAGSAFSK